MEQFTAIPFVIPDGSNFRTAILAEALASYDFISTAEGRKTRKMRLSPVETVLLLLLLKLSLVNPRTS